MPDALTPPSPGVRSRCQHGPLTRRGRRQCAPAHRVRQCVRLRVREVTQPAAGPTAARGAGGDGTTVTAGPVTGADRRADGVRPGHGGPLDRPLQHRRCGGPSRSAPQRTAQAGRQPADRMDRRAAGAAATAKRLRLLPAGAVVWAADETHLHPLPHVRSNWTLPGRRTHNPTPGKNRQLTVLGALEVTSVRSRSAKLSFTEAPGAVVSIRAASALRSAAGTSVTASGQ